MDTYRDPMRDKSNLDIEDWNRIADRYLDNGDSGGPTANPMYLQLKSVLWECLGDVHGLQVLDLGCGDGWFSSVLVDASASVVSIDGSLRLLEHGQARDRRVTFLQADLALGLPEGLEKFDRVVSLMVLMDIPELDLLFADLRNVIAETGRFIFVILHPCTFQYKIQFDEARQEWYRRMTNYQDQQVWRIDSFGGHNHYHRNLTYYADLLRRHRFAITRLYEPEWNPEPSAENAHVVRRWPICLLVEARPMQAEQI